MFDLVFTNDVRFDMKHDPLEHAVLRSQLYIIKHEPPGVEYSKLNLIQLNMYDGKRKI